jgi:hypothetical protein
VAEGNGDPCWHAHVPDEDGRELAVALALPEATTRPRPAPVFRNIPSRVGRNT